MSTDERQTLTVTSNGSYFWAGATLMSWGILWLFWSRVVDHTNLSTTLLSAFYITGGGVSLLLLFKLITTPIVQLKIRKLGGEVQTTAYGVFRVTSTQWRSDLKRNELLRGRVFGGDTKIVCLTSWGEFVAVYLGTSSRSIQKVMRSLTTTSSALGENRAKNASPERLG